MSLIAGEARRRPSRLPALSAAFLEGVALPDEHLRLAVHSWQQLGVFSSIAELAAREPDELRAALAKAARRGLIPELGEEEAAAVLAEAQAAALRHTLDQPLRRSGASLGELLTLTSVSETDGAAFLRRLGGHDGGPASFWSTLAADPKLAPTAAALRSALELGGLVEFRTPLISALLAQRTAGDLASARDLVGRDDDWWGDLLRQAGGTAAQDVDDVAGRIVDNVARAFPTATLAHRLRRERDPDVRRALGTASAGLDRLLRRQPDLDLRTTPIPRLLAKDPALLDDLAPDERVKFDRDLTRLQRVFRLVDGYDQLRVLVKEGFDSAHAIRRAGHRGFGERIAPHLGPIPADLAYRRAASTTDSGLNLWATFSPALQRTPMTVLGTDVADVSEMFGPMSSCSCGHCGSVFGPAAYFVELLKFLSDRRIRRGPLGAIPPGPPGLRPRLPETALEVLLARRPDLGEIELTCENADTPVLVVDLVTEILERAVAPLSVPAGIGGFGGDRVSAPLRAALAREGVEIAPDAPVEEVEPDRRWVIRQPGLRVVVGRQLFVNGAVVPGGPLTVRVLPQSVGNAEELAAYPRFVSREAYALLTEAARPWTLPFHLGLAEIRATMHQLGSSRLEVMEALGPDPDRAVAWRDPVVAFEQLGMSRRQAQLVMGTGSDSVWALWGVQPQNNVIPDPLTPSVTVTGSGVEVLRHVSIFLDRSGLTFADLLHLLETWFVNRPTAAGDRPIQLVDAGRCDPSEARLEGFRDIELPRTHLFLRLWRALGWSMAEVDLAVDAFQPATGPVSSTAEPVLVQLSQAQRLQARLGLPVETLLSFWRPLSTRLYRDPLVEGRPDLPSLFDRVFRSRLTSGPASSPFTLDAGRAELIGPPRPLINARSEICSSLGLTPDELDRFLTEPELDGSPVLDLATLSHLHRSTVLARALGLQIADYLATRALIGDPFTVPAGSPIGFHPPEATLRFVAAVDTVREAGVTIDQLDELLRDRLPGGIARSAARDAVDRLLLDLLDGLRPIDTDAARRSYIVATVSDRLGLVAAVTGQLCETILPSLTDPALHLLDDLVAASGGGLTADYVNGTTPTGPAALRRTDRSISFNWTTTPPPAALPATSFSARWAGGVRVDTTGTYTFTVSVTGTARLRVAGRLLIDHTAASRETITATVDLEAGLLTEIELTFVSPVAGGAALDLGWITPAGVTEPVPASALLPDDARRGLIRLDKWARLVGMLGFSADEMLVLGRLGAQPGWLAPTDLPDHPTSSAQELFPRYRRLVELSQVMRQLPAGAVFDLMARAGAAATSESAFLDDLAERARWNRSDLDFLRAPGRWNFGMAEFRDERLYVRLAALFDLLARLGMSASDAWAFSRADDDPGFAEPVAARQAIRARREDGRWLDAAAVVRDQLREPQQQALVGHLVEARRLADPAALSAQVLVDVEMSSCATTTRLAHAINTVQTFVERCRLNLEDEVSADEDADPEWRQWEWMKNYRVWEASRKVFLYPENWIEPELRDDKSPFFRELESELLQGDLDDETAEAAIERYLEKLHEVARLDIRAICEEPGRGSGAARTLHLIGRTQAPPHVYYHRRRIDDGYWTAWEKIDVDIEGDHLMAIVANRRLTILWPVIVEQTNPDAADDAQPERAKKMWRVQLAWSEYRRDAWSPKKVSSGNLTVPLHLQLTTGGPAPGATADPNSGVSLRGLVGGMFELFLPPAPGEGRASPPMFIAQDEDRSSLYFQVADNDSLVVRCYSRPARNLPPRTEDTPVPHEERINSALDAGAEAFDEFLGLWRHIPFLGELVREPFDFLARADRPGESWASDIGEFAMEAALLGFDEGIVGFGMVTARIVGVGTAVAALVFADADMTRDMLAEVLEDLRDDYEEGRNSRLADLERDLDEKLEEKSGVLYVPRNATGIPDLARRAIAIATAIVEAVPSMSPKKRVDPEQSADHFSWGSFAINCSDHVSVDSTWPESLPMAVTPEIVPNADTQFNAIREERDNDTLQLFTSSGSRETILEATPKRFRLARPNPLRDASVRQPFVYWDASRTFLAKRRGSHGILDIFIPDGLAVRDAVTRLGMPAALGQLGAAGGESPDLPPFARPLWSFETLEHPFVCDFREALDEKGVRGLLRRSEQQATGKPFFQGRYQPTWTPVRDFPYPVNRVDFTFDGSYALYNWELFFHIPFLIATQLSRNQRFADAQKWFHFIFDPTASDSGGDSAAQYWRTLPFFETSRTGYVSDQADRLMERLAAGEPDPRLEAQVDDWRAHPFSPHRIARLRPSAYQKAIVMRYLDNLVDWGDQLFRRDTSEALNEAAGLYAQAARILGPRPQLVPASDTSPVQTWAGLERAESPGALEELEVFVPPPSLGGAVDDDVPHVSFPDPETFCVPPNDRLLGYWDTVADRLFKIRHCMDIEGTVRQLPPFGTKIDPALLVRATAVGVDIASVLGDIAAAPSYRFTVLHQKALELCAEVRGLGAGLLSALEKRDAETLSALRSTQETGLLRAVRDVREQQLAEARAGREALGLSRRVVQARFDYYDTVAFLNPMESAHLDLVGGTLALQYLQSGIDYFGNLIALVPNAKVGLPTTMGVTFGGDNLAQAVRAYSSYLGSMVSILGTTGSLAATMGGHARRADEWRLQRDLAEKELKQLDKQLVAAEIREAMTELELANHDRQIADSQQVESFLKTKHTGEELFSWMSGQLAALHFQAYQLAYDVAGRAQAAFRLEVGDDTPTFLRFGHWDTLRKGLLSGEQLALDLRRMEAAHLERKREAELTRHVSLALLNPRQLLHLRQTGTCDIEVPEALFDLDHPGHFLRRITSVSVTIPCVTGPYVGVPGKLTLLKSRIRRTADIGAGYQAPTGDPRMAEHDREESVFLSSGQADAGLFEANLRDERFLPFEGRGVISTWTLELPDQFRPFDYDTISDVILHMRYTARDGGAALRTACVTDLRASLNAIAQGSGASGFARLFMARQEAPDRFTMFRNPPGAADRHELTISLTTDRFPFLVRDRTVNPRKLEVFVKVTLQGPVARSSVKVALGQPGTNPTPQVVTDELGMLRLETPATTLGDWTLHVWQEESGNPAVLSAGSAIEEVFLICYYEVT